MFTYQRCYFVFVSVTRVNHMITQCVLTSKTARRTRHNTSHRSRTLHVRRLNFICTLALSLL